jgi:hypothetical protein
VMMSCLDKGQGRGFSMLCWFCRRKGALEGLLVLLWVRTVELCIERAIRTRKPLLLPKTA